MTEFLTLENMSRHFGGLVAVDNLSFSVAKGEIVGLIGPNGAGKSTTFNVITGYLSPTKGKILLKGEDISGLKPHIIARKGVTRTFQLTVLFPELSVLENILLGIHLRSTVFNPFKILFSRFFFPKDEINRAMEIIEMTGLSHVKDQKAKDLPHGIQRMLGLAIVLGAEPEMILLDEPVTGMNLDEIKAMINLIKQLHPRGLTILLIEHNIKTVMDLCERIVVLSFGKKIAEGSPSEVSQNQDVITAYLGDELT